MAVKTKVDKRLLANMLRLEELRPMMEEHKQLDREVKTQLKEDYGDGDHAVGPFDLSIMTYDTTYYDLPDKVKDKYKKTRSQTRVKWVKT